MVLTRVGWLIDDRMERWLPFDGSVSLKSILLAEGNEQGEEAEGLGEEVVEILVWKRGEGTALGTSRQCHLRLGEKVRVSAASKVVCFSVARIKGPHRRGLHLSRAGSFGWGNRGLTRTGISQMRRHCTQPG